MSGPGSDRSSVQTPPQNAPQPDRTRLVLAIILGGLLAVISVILAVWLLPPLLMDSPYIGVSPAHAVITFADAEKTLNDIRHSIVETAQVIVTIVTGAAVVFTLYLTGRNVQAAERTASVAEETARKNLQLQQEIRIGERFSKAVDQLSNTSCAVRVGAIHTLARVARESKDDHWPIVELLCAYLRDQLPVAKSTAGATTVPPEDAKAVAVFIRTRHVEHEDPGQFIDLSSTNLHGLIFDGAKLVGANLDNSMLGGARFIHADLSGAHLVIADAAGSTFSNAIFKGAFLNGADFTRAQMSGVDLADASVTNAIFESVVGPIYNVTDEQRRAAKDLK